MFTWKEGPTGGRDRLIRRKQSTLPAGEGCSGSLGDEEMCFLGIVLRPVLLVAKGERTCRSRGLHILQGKLKCCPKSPQCFPPLSFLGILLHVYGLQANLALCSSGFVFISVQQGLETFVASFELFPGEGKNETVLVYRGPDKKPALNEVKFLFQGNPEHM